MSLSGWGGGGGELKAGDYSEILTVDRQCNGRVVTPFLTLFRLIKMTLRSELAGVSQVCF